MSTMPECLQEFYRRLAAAPRATSAEEALEQASRILEEVEDDLSGIPKQTPPPLPGMTDGRMYPPQPDLTVHQSDGRIIARTRGHVIEIEADGGLAIRNLKAGQTEFTR